MKNLVDYQALREQQEQNQLLRAKVSELIKALDALTQRVQTLERPKRVGW